MTARPPRAAPLERQLCFSLYTAVARLTRRYRPLLAPLGLTYPQYLAMLALWERAPRSVGELTDALGLDVGTSSPLLKRLERAGLVRRERDRADERRVMVTLTDSGRALEAAAAAIPAQLACAIDLPAAELAALKQAVDRFGAALRQGADETVAP
ncbi:MarR family winged helix-turn-helix transcriptional regulator [Dokdonella koreensis]|uniref:Organic hydroperoxide resistance transcriptional regulator n=1 Tax=Dokdonella koreensis DS-123 TaxID=1300342 RepID=A0A167GXC5_9GAMM|nr:MarR family transcriptional regulator [Dokdonella koreensis]ANB18032.1 Organic hydroperoxide resistance transcriptional regulator [Dokdonella koreensis DS-123]